VPIVGMLVFSLPALCCFAGASRVGEPSDKTAGAPPRFVLDLRGSPAGGPKSPNLLRLWRSEGQRTPGHAPLPYYRPLGLDEDEFRRQVTGQDQDFLSCKVASIRRWLYLPLGDLPRHEVAAELQRLASVFSEVAQGGSRRGCDWELDSRSDGIVLLLPD